MIVDVIFFGSIAYLAALIVWRLLSLRRPKAIRTSEKRESTLALQIFGRGWIRPAVALVLVATTFVLKTDLDIFNRWTDQERAELSHFVQAVTYYDEATSLYLNRDYTTYEDWESVNALLQSALAEGEQVRPELLKRLHPELPQKFQERFLAGLRAGTYGLRHFTAPIKKNDTAVYFGLDSLDAGRTLLGEWGEWYIANREHILNKVD